MPPSLNTCLPVYLPTYLPMYRHVSFHDNLSAYLPVYPQASLPNSLSPFLPPAYCLPISISIIIIHSFYIALFSALEQTHCAHWHVILNE